MTEYPSTLKVAAYPRVSTEEQKQHGLSIEAQTAALEDWARRNGVTIQGFYNDAGNSARKPYHKRPAMVRLLEDVKAGRIDLIVFTKLDRWFRNVGEYYKVQEILEAHGVQWKAINEDYDTSTASGRLKVNIMLSVAQDEADRGSERIRAVFDAKRENKEPVTGHMPTGYMIEDKKIVKDPEWEPSINCFFDTFQLYHSIERARQEVYGQHGKTISYPLAAAILRKEAYYGSFSGIEGMCPAYITKEQYDENAANRRRTERKTIENRIYLFTGLAVCSECGRRFAARCHRYAVRSGGHHERVAYNCPGRYLQGDCENHVNIGECVVEEHLLSHVDRSLEERVAELYRLTSTSPTRNFSEERSKLKKKLSRLKDLYLNELIDLEMYRKDYDCLHTQLKLLTEEEAAAQPSPRSADWLKDIFTPGWQDMYEGLSRAEKQCFWRVAIKEIAIHPDRRITFTFRD